MSSALRLGPISFKAFEIPEHISFGGKQRIVIHHLPGGNRVVDTLGADEGPVRWSGIFSGEDAGERVRALDLLRKSGATLLLTWDGWRFLVIIQDFLVDFTHASWIPYAIRLCVIPSPLDIAIDWLSQAAGPVLSLAALPTTALQETLASSSLGLSGGSLGAVVSSAGLQAQAVTAMAYAGRLR